MLIRHVYPYLEFQTRDAAGQNMVTIATQAICDCIQQHSPVKPVAALTQAGELSVIGALTAGGFGRARERLACGKKPAQ